MIEIRPPTDDDVDRMIALSSQAFNIPASSHERIRSEMRLEHARVAEVGGRVVASARIWPFGHYFGGRPVRAAGISGVAVGAEARGKGVGRALMQQMHRELRGDGVPIASLYPATVPIYRSVGYGYGGVRTFWRAKLEALPASGGAEVVEFTEPDEIAPVYEGLSAETNGLLRRDDDWWRKRVLTPWEKDQAQYRYAVREDGRVTGWIVYTLEKSRGDEWRSRIECRDLFWRTPEAARTLLSLAALHRSTSATIEWMGPTTDPIADLTREDSAENAHSFRYMVRLLDVPAAFEARGYHPLLDTTVAIGVRDPLFAENDGPWQVTVAGGRAKVAPAARADATADVQTWASIWTGLLRARDAVRQGTLEATEDAVVALEAIFAGPTPWIADFY